MSIFIGKNTILLDCVDSTNSYARSHAEWPDGTVITTREQQQGRGQQGNFWESEAGRNLTFSIVLKPTFIPPEEQFYLSKAISLGVADFLSVYLDNVSIKWPNDIYVDDSKIAGILIEQSITGNIISQSIVGIGLNVNQTIFRSNAPNPTSIKLRAAREFNLHESLSHLCTYIENRYLQLQTDLIYEMNNDYMKRLYRLGIWSDFESQGERFKARIIKVEDSGRLILERMDGATDGFYFKEVSYVLNSESSH